MKLFSRLAQQLERPYLRYQERLATELTSVLQKLPKPLRELPDKTPPIPLVVGLTVLSLTTAVGQRFYNTPRLDVNREAPQTIYAPANATVIDKKATEDKQKAARTSAISVMMLDRFVNQQIRSTVQRYFEQGNEIRQQAGNFPFAETAALTQQTQVYLRKANTAEWQDILSHLNSGGVGKKPTHANPKDSKNNSLKPEQRRALSELQAYQRSVQAGDYANLLQTINRARSQYEAALATLSSPSSGSDAADQTRLISNPAFLDLPDRDWQDTQNRTNQILDRILAQGISQGLPESMMKDAVNLQVKGTVPGGTEPLVAQVLLASLQPNLVRDEEQTRLRAEQAAQQVAPQIITIRQGEVIVRAGQAISPEAFALLDYFKLSRREINWIGLISYGALVSGAVGGYWFIERRFQPIMRRRDRLLIWLLCLSTPLLVALHVPSTNLPALGMLVGSFYGSPLGLTAAGLMSLLLAAGVQMPWSQLLSSAAGGMVCGWMAGRLRTREELALLGTGAGVLQGLLYLLLNVASGTVWYTLLGAAGVQALLGLAWCIVAIGISPYLEQVFDLVTTIRLVELANPNRPLLKQLSAKTPGTFQHTLLVATLAEAAARALGCNVELVRTGTLYHDIGKMHDPLGFIENQMGGPNKHDLIDDPWQSAAIIKKHVTEGLVMARKYRLPKAVQSFIPEHQGTMMIAYFYHQAQQRVKESPDGSVTIRDEDFRYDGPAPQSRETGIVMLADSCEAALRSLKDATPQEALAMINKILRARWQDKQLEHSGLTREDMSKIAHVFVEVWQQFNHQRIAYPKAMENPKSALRSK
jgi:putative nucleotidyltransferase with HDIG domain